MSVQRPWRSLVAALMLGVAGTGCGIRPTGVVDAGRPAGGVRVYLVADGKLRPVVRPNLPGGDPVSAVGSLFLGPQVTERAAGLTTAVPASVSLVNVKEGAGKIDLVLNTDPARLSDLAILQIACTAATAPTEHRRIMLAGPRSSTRVVSPCPLTSRPK
jgi:spore germination protein GerM